MPVSDDRTGPSSVTVPRTLCAGARRRWSVGARVLVREPTATCVLPAVPCSPTRTCGEHVGKAWSTSAQKNSRRRAIATALRALFKTEDAGVFLARKSPYNTRPLRHLALCLLPFIPSIAGSVCANFQFGKTKLISSPFWLGKRPQNVCGLLADCSPQLQGRGPIQLCFTVKFVQLPASTRTQNRWSRRERGPRDRAVPARTARTLRQICVHSTFTMGGAVGRPKYMGQLRDGKRHGQVWRSHTRAVCQALAVSSTTRVRSARHLQSLQPHCSRSHTACRRCRRDACFGRTAESMTASSSMETGAGART